MSIDDHWFQDCHDFILGLMITTYIKGYLRLRKNNVCHLIHHHPLIWQTKTSWQVDHQDHLMVSMYIYIFLIVSHPWHPESFGSSRFGQNITKQEIVMSHPPHKESMADMLGFLKSQLVSTLSCCGFHDPWPSPYTNVRHLSPHRVQELGGHAIARARSLVVLSSSAVRGDRWFLYDFSGWCTSTTIYLWLIYVNIISGWWF